MPLTHAPLRGVDPYEWSGLLGCLGPWRGSAGVSCSSLDAAAVRDVSEKGDARLLCV